MVSVFLLNPRRRANTGTSAGVKKGWKKRKSSYGSTGDRKGVRKVHEAGYTVKALRDMTAAQRRKTKISRSVLEGLGFAKKKSAAKTKRKNPRKNAWFANTDGHSKAATKKWGYKRAKKKPKITLYDLIGDFGVKEGQRRYALLKDRQKSYSSPRTKETKGMARKKTRRRSTTKRRRKNPAGSTKRRRAAKKAAATRKRNAAKRSAAAKKAARTRKRRRRRNPAPTRRRTRRRTTTARQRNPHRRTSSAARSRAAKKGWRKRRASGTRRRKNTGRKRTTRRRRRRNPSLGRPKARRYNRKRRRTRRRRRNPIGIMGRIMAALPTTGDLKDAGWISGGLFGVGFLSNLLKTNATTAKWLGTPTMTKFMVPELLSMVVGTAGLSMALKGTKRAKQFMLGGLLNIMLKVWKNHVKDMMPKALQLDPLGDYVQMGSYVQYPPQAGMGSYVQFGQADPVRQAAQIPSYEPAPYDVGMPMGEYEDVAGYYGVTAY